MIMMMINNHVYDHDYDILRRSTQTFTQAAGSSHSSPPPCLFQYLAGFKPNSHHDNDSHNHDFYDKIIIMIIIMIIKGS